ncbi:ead/Ea22-like family protein [Cronobacter dublinensis]|uniref:ead/Ea22-like family protein n=1 Tax=Cronobacter dublinensis TaxID=413497 RepID=UPI000CFD7DAC|nr:ead/Ea22-like family protein [Cronobacter dublinensis]
MTIDTAKLKSAALAAGGEEWAPRDQTKNCGEYTVIVKGSLETHSGCTSYRPIADGVVNKQVMKFIALANPAAVLELIAALEAAQKRNAELEESHKKLRDAMAVIHNTIRLDGLNAPLAAIMSRAKRAHEESAAAAGINLETGGEA